MKNSVTQRIQPLRQPSLASPREAADGSTDTAANAKSGGLTLVQKARALASDANTPPAHTCQQCLWISFFFDGTGNNRKADKPTQEHSNIARLWQSHIDEASAGIAPIYIPGIGTPFPEIGDDGKGPIPFIDLSKGMGARGQGRLDFAFEKLALSIKEAEARAQNPTNKIVWIKLAVFGFSRGATLARAFVRDLLDPKLGKTSQEHGELQWTGAQGRYPLSIQFMGLFDTVASVGAPMSANNVKAVRNERRRSGTMNRMCSRLRKAVGWRWAVLALLPALQACQPTGAQQEAAVAAAEARIPPPHEALDPLDTDGGKRIVLTVTGFNNTNRDIDSFSVNGAGGGNLRAGSGGGGSCCGNIPSDIPWDLIQFKVRWAAGGCMAVVTNSYGESREVIRYFYKEKMVRLKEPLPLKPSDLEVHFFPGEKIEVRITEIGSLPLPFDKSTEDLTPFPPCDGKKP